MHRQTLQELLDKKLLSTEQFTRLDDIATGKVYSLFYELRTLLYLGVMLFSAGVGYLIYLHIGQLGHLISIIALGAIMVGCFAYAFLKGPEYSHQTVAPPSPYFDYVVLLGALLVVTIQGYVQFQFGILSDKLEYATLVTAFYFFLIAYRFDHAGVLAMAITAFASFWSISLTPVKWHESDFLETAGLPLRALLLGGVLTAVALLLDKAKVKSHFTFTYLNFGILMWLTGALAAVFQDDLPGLYWLLLACGCAATVWLSRKVGSFLLLLYAVVYGYLGTSYLIGKIISDPFFWFLYTIGSCGAFVVFVVRYKRIFKRKE